MVLKSDSIRLNKYISNSGICSRRDADEHIKAGFVEVNGKIIRELGSKISPGDVVKFKGRIVKAEKKVYLLLNKPEGYVTTLDDPHAEKTVMQLIKGACKERIYPVGRLDRNTTGVLLLTNDGELAKKLTHPSSNEKKVYRIHLDKKLKKEDMVKITRGFQLEDGFIHADSISYASSNDEDKVLIEIHSGRKRIIKRLFDHLGYTITKLDRVCFAGLTKKNLEKSKWRFLTEGEVDILKKGTCR